MLKGVVVRRSGVVDGFESEKQNLKINAGVDGRAGGVKVGVQG